MKLRHGLFAALFMAVLLPAAAMAAGMFSSYPAATAVTGIECIPADSNLTQGLTPATECLTPGQASSLAISNIMGVYASIPIGPVALASLGTNTTDIAGQVWFTSIQIPVDKTVTGIGCLQGATATTDKTNFSLYNSAGTLLGNSATAGVLLSGASTFQRQALVTATAVKAGQYWIGVQGNGTAAGAIATVAASTYLTVASTVASGTFGTLPAMTPVVTFTADKAPICYVY